MDTDRVTASDHTGLPSPRQGLLRAVFDESPIAVLRVTYPDRRVGDIVDANPAAARLTGWAPDDLVGAALEEVLPGATNAPIASGGTLTLERRTDRAGSPSWVAITISPLSESGPDDVPLALVIVQDVSEQFRATAQLDRQARKDPLTGLNNREEILRQLSAVAPESDGPLVGVIFLDLDGFKLVNDTRGHQVGDELLVAVARRIRSAVRPEDSLARLGGDEFLILCPRVGDPQEIGILAERIRATLDDPVSVEGRAHRISMSVGIAIAPAGSVDPHDLLRQADMAMYRAKDAGRNRVRVHSVEMDEELATAELIRGALAAALTVERDSGETAGTATDTAGIVLHFQPIVEIATGKLAYVEALARLRLADGALAFPSQFLSVASRAGFSGALSEQVLRMALSQRARWVAEDVDVPVALNLARGQVYSASFAGDALRLIAEMGDAAGSVVFEMDEFGLLEAMGPAQLTLRRLRNSGIGLAVDHFGTGNSSLGALRFLGPNRVKIDRSFVASITNSIADRAIVTAAISAAHALGQRVVAEGVETEEQLGVLAELGCDEAQGFLVAPVLPADQLRLAMTRWAPVTLERHVDVH